MYARLEVGGSELQALPVHAALLCRGDGFQTDGTLEFVVGGAQPEGDGGFCCDLAAQRDCALLLLRLNRGVARGQAVGQLRFDADRIGLSVAGDFDAQADFVGTGSGRSDRDDL
jgi:hypothetical protein